MNNQSDYGYTVSEPETRSRKLCVQRARFCNRYMLKGQFTPANPIYWWREMRDRWMQEARLYPKVED